MNKVESEMINIPVIKNTSYEHGAIMAAKQRLEEALSSQAKGCEKEWASWVAKELRNLRESLRLHSESVEEPGGLLSELHNKIAVVNKRLTDTCNYHPKLLRECDELLETVELLERGEAISVCNIRRKAAVLIDDILHHQAYEADLIFEVFDRDIGSID
jgi:hypothetical protein